MTCAECEHAVTGIDFLCMSCRAKADGDPVCDYCGDLIPTSFSELAFSATWKEHMVEPRFKGLCARCKELANSCSNPFNPTRWDIIHSERVMEEYERT